MKRSLMVSVLLGSIVTVQPMHRKVQRSFDEPSQMSEIARFARPKKCCPAFKSLLQKLYVKVVSWCACFHTQSEIEIVSLDKMQFELRSPSSGTLFFEEFTEPSPISDTDKESQKNDTLFVAEIPGMIPQEQVQIPNMSGDEVEYEFIERL